MTLTLDLPPDVERAFRAQAEARGVGIDTVVREVLIAALVETPPARTVFERGLGLFGSPADAALLDDVVAMAHEERRRPSPPPAVSL
jgi:hypothetical protein